VKLKLRNTHGKLIGSVDVRDDVFGVTIDHSVVHQVMVGQLANARQGTAKTKTRSQVSGGGAKPRPQKGTGAARAGTIRAPQWRGGGVVNGPIPRSYRHNTPKRLRRKALLMTLSSKVQDDQLLVLDNIDNPEYKTKGMVKLFDTLDAGPSILLVADGVDKSLLRSVRNIPKVRTLEASLLNTVDVLNNKTLIMTLESIRKAESLWGGPFTRRKSRVEEQ
jgi:large subunit ribosomal protein L4